MREEDVELIAPQVSAFFFSFIFLEVCEEDVELSGVSICTLVLVKQVK